MGKIAFVFSGQGAQYVGMGKALADSFPSAARVFQEADQALGVALSELCFEGPKEHLDQTENTQPAILTTSVAALTVLKEQGIEADLVAGLSLGEYTALIAAGALSFSDGVPLVKKRGRFMQEAVPLGVGGMAALFGLEAETVQDICRRASEAGVVEAANYNCPGQIVIGGEKAAVALACQLAKEQKAKAIPLPVSAPFHTSLLQPAAERLAAELQAIQFKEPKLPVISNVTGDYIQGSQAIQALLTRQVREPVLWEPTLSRMLSEGVDQFVEIGPGKALSGFIKRMGQPVSIFNVEDPVSLEKTLEGILKGREAGC